MTKKLKVLVVDDSAVGRDLIGRALSDADDIEVAATAVDAFDAREKIFRLKPDVVTLDIEMPKVDGLTFLGKLMAHYPLPVVVISAFTPKNSDIYLRALEAGAVSVIQKPKIQSAADFSAAAHGLKEAVRQASAVNLHAMHRQVSGTQARAKESPARREVTFPAKPEQKRANASDCVLIIGSSTGGPEALKNVLTALPAKVPPILIVQHMPPVFTRNFAERLNQLCRFSVKEAEDGDLMKHNLALLAPGDFHVTVDCVGSEKNIRLSLDQGPQIHGVRPAVDKTMISLGTLELKKVIGVILTGMGKDGAAGLKVLRDAGAKTVVQDEKSCVVYGMPKAAVAVGAAEKVLPLDKIAEELTRLFGVMN